MSKKFNILSVILILLVSITITNKTFQNDTFYIIKVGQSILQNGVDMIDHFSIHSIIYPYEHWLYNLFIYLIYYLWGFKGIYISTICLCFILGLAIYFCNIKLTKNQLVSSLVTIIILAFSKPFITARAQLVSYILFVLEIYFIESLLKTGRKKDIIALIFISWLISNIHAAVWPMFIIFFLPYLFTNLICSYKEKSINIKLFKLKITKKAGKLLLGLDHADSVTDKIIFKRYSNIKLLIIALIFSIFIGLFVPNNFQNFTYYFKTSLGVTTNYINEHQPTILWQNPGYLLTLGVVIAYLIFIKIRIHIKDLLMLIGLALMSIFSNRHISLFLIIGSFSIIKLFGDYFSNYAIKTYHILINSIIKPITSTIIILFIFLISFFNYYNNIMPQKYVDEKAYPVKAATFINNNVDKKHMRLYNEYNYGSYLIYRNIKVFIDSRSSLYTKQFNKMDRDIAYDYFTIEDKDNYKKIFKIYKITHALVPKNSIMYKSLKFDINYKIIYKDKYFVLFEKIN